MEKTFYTNNFNQTINLGKEIAKAIKSGTIITLHGNLGAGKTTFVQGLAKGLGIKKRVVSPTFVLVRSYILDGGRKFHHIDLYRIELKKDIKKLGIAELFEDKNNIIAIEWPEKINNLPKKRIDVFFEYLSDTKREIRVKNYE